MTDTQEDVNPWKLADAVINKNNEVRSKAMSEEVEEAKNVMGFVINSIGNIVSQFGFFVEEKTEDTMKIKISADGFLAKVYNEPVNLIYGYGDKLDIPGIINPKKSQILKLGPDVTQGEDLLIEITIDDHLKTEGVIFLIRDKDVMVETLIDDIRDEYKKNIKQAKYELANMNELEKSYNNYMKHLYVVLGEERNEPNYKVEVHD